MAAGHERPGRSSTASSPTGSPSIGGAVVAVGGSAELADADGAYGRWFADARRRPPPCNGPTSCCSGRPPTPPGLPTLVRSLRDALQSGLKSIFAVRLGHGPCTTRTVARRGRLRGGAIRHPVRPPAARRRASRSTRSPSSTASASASCARRSPAWPARTSSRRRPSAASASARLSLDHLHDLTWMRIQIETLALRQSIAKGDISWEADLVAAHHRLAVTPTYFEDGTGNTDWLTAHGAFHAALAAACREPDPRAAAPPALRRRRALPHVVEQPAAPPHPARTSPTSTRRSSTPRWPATPTSPSTS